MDLKAGHVVFKYICCVLLTSSVVFGQGTPADKCTQQVNNCACKTDKGYINLAPLDTAKSTGQPRFKDVSDRNYNTYSYNPCTAFSSNTCNNVAGCQNHYDIYYAIGYQDSATFTYDTTNNIPTLTYQAVTDDTRTMTISLYCDKTQEQLIANGEDFGSASFKFELHTKYACSDVAPAPGGSSGGLSGGSILIIICICLALTYLVAGIAFQYFRKGARGKEMIPNLEFWTSLPGLIKDGAIFAWRKITRKPTENSKYDEI